MSWLPTYFNSGLGVKYSSVGLYSLVPFVVMFTVSNLTAWLADALVVRGFDTTFVRKLMQTIEHAVGAACFLIVMTRIHSPGLALMIACLTMVFLGFSAGGWQPNGVELGPRYAGVITGIGLTVSVLPESSRCAFLRGGWCTGVTPGAPSSISAQEFIWWA